MPKKPGMYSYILNVVDRANNSQYARTLVLYDNISSVSSNESSPMLATSAAEETNYKWQNNLTNNISVSWENHFSNFFHEANKLLVPVSQYKYNDFEVKFQKAVPDKLEDLDGKRTLEKITNVNGIVKFAFTFGNANQGDKPTNQWHIVNDIFKQAASFNVPRANGDSLNVWVKAEDILGNEKIDMMRVYFDETPPDEIHDQDVIFQKNLENSTLPFSSR